MVARQEATRREGSVGGQTEALPVPNMATQDPAPLSSHAHTKSMCTLHLALASDVTDPSMHTQSPTSTCIPSRIPHMLALPRSHFEAGRTHTHTHTHRHSSPSLRTILATPNIAAACVTRRAWVVTPTGSGLITKSTLPGRICN